MLKLQDLSDALDDIESDSKPSELLKLRKSLEADYKKNLLENVDKDEVLLLKFYFNRLLNKDDLTSNDVATELNNYIEDSDNEPYSRIIQNLIKDVSTNKISIDQFSDFMIKFVNQPFPIDIFYKRYFNTSPFPPPTMIDLFGEEISSSSEDEEKEAEAVVQEEDTLQKIRNRIEEVREEPKTTILIDPHTEKRGKVTVITDNIKIIKRKNLEPKPITDKIYFDSMADITKQDCEFLYRKIPWVKDIVSHIYIHPIEGDFNDIIDYGNFIEYDNKKFYSPKEKYYNLQCFSNKIQKGYELTIVKNGEMYKLIIAIDTNTRGIVLQNEDMLKAEVDYIRIWNQNKEEHIKELKSNLPTEDMILLSKFELSSSLQDAIKGTIPIEYRNSNSYFIDIVIQTILKNSKSGEEFSRILSNIIIFLKINLSFLNSSVFIKRLREQIYLPDSLPFLTDADKLPEIFLLKNVPEDTKMFVLQKLDEERLKFTRNFFENLHIGASLLRKPTKPILWNKPTLQIELPDIKTICKNREHIEEENDEDVVFYTDMDDVYCFNVYKLYDLFGSTVNPVNPYTGRPFTNKFIQTFLTRYASKPLIKKIENTTNEDTISTLENLIEKELNILENNLIEVENPSFIEKFKSSITPITPIVKDTNLSKCLECKDNLSDNKINSIFRNKQVSFCGYECLEKNKAFK